ESHWNLAFYTPEADYYNFQIWAGSTDKLSSLVNEIIKLLTVEKPIAQYDMGEAPAFFVNKAEVAYGQLSLQVTNRSEANQVMAKGFYRSTETANKAQFEEALSLQPREQEEIRLDLEGIYDLGLTFYSEKIAMPDVIFMADGVWGTDYDASKERVDDFSVSNSSSHDYDGRSLERDVSIHGEVEASVALFRSLNAAWRPADVSSFQNLTFHAAGTAQVEVTLVKSSVKDWEDQPRYFFNLSGQERQVVINKEDFTTSGQGNTDWTDVISVVFDVRGNQTTPTPFDLEVSNVGFTNNVITAAQESTQVQHLLYPNPAKGYFKLSFPSAKPDNYTVQLFAQTGQLVSEWNGQLQAGANELTIRDLPSSKGLYYYKITTGSNQQATGKVFIID
ncbi:MAG: T9SS type A sorting domain-containing protein, partial [Bacteroidota bacterium]